MGGVRILWFNWKCIKHPEAGGAEVYTHEVAKRLSAMGHEVVLVTSKSEKLSTSEFIDGYKVIRCGGRYSIYYNAWKIYRKLCENYWKPNVVIDEVNTIPFLTPLYVREPIVMLIHQLCRECWSYAIHPVVQPLGWFIEKRFHKLYIDAVRDGKVRAVITVSNSTMQDLVNLGYPADRVYIAYNGLDLGSYGDCAKLSNGKEDLIVYIGRISPYKRLEELLKAWKYVEHQCPNAVLLIAGRPIFNYLKKLVKLAKELELKHVEFRLNISQFNKKHILAKAKALVYTSIREGWGQTVLEAAACKTPAIAYNVPGLRDSVKHMETGVLVDQGDIRQLAEAILLLLTDNSLQRKLAENAYEYVHQFNWNSTVEMFIKVLG